jgi:hypothetical protein
LAGFHKVEVQHLGDQAVQAFGIPVDVGGEGLDLGTLSFIGVA